MGFEILYALMENVAWIGMIASVVLIVLLIVLGLARIGNDIDRDDWAAMMMWVVPALVLTLTLSAVPSRDHVIDVYKVFNEAKTLTKDEKNETNPIPVGIVAAPGVFIGHLSDIGDAAASGSCSRSSRPDCISGQ